MTTPFHLWRSTDAGASFEAIGTPGCDAPAALGLPVCPPEFETTRSPLEGSGDGDLARMPGGRLAWIGLNGAEGRELPFQVSDDEGTTWTAAVDLGTGRETDRPWITAMGGRSLLVNWREGPGEAEAAILARVSRDGGESWSQPTRVAPDAWMGPAAFDPIRKSILIPYFDDGLAVAIADENASAWRTARVTDEPPGAFPARNGGPLGVFPIAAFDAAGNAFLVWSRSTAHEATANVKATDVPAVYFSSSVDGGSTWTGPIPLSTPGKGALMPWIVAGGEDAVAIAWYEGAQGTPNEFVGDAWRVRVTLSIDASAASPSFATAFVTPSPTHVGSMCTDGQACLLGARDRSAQDFFELVLDDEGRPAVAFVGDGDASSRVRATVYFARATEGTSLT